MTKQGKTKIKTVVFLGLCWFCAVWMPLYLPWEQSGASLAVSVYGLFIVLLGMSEKKAIKNRERRAAISWLGLIPLWAGYGASVFHVLS